MGWYYKKFKKPAKISHLKAIRLKDGSNFPDDKNIEKLAQTMVNSCNNNKKEIKELYADVVANIINLLFYILFLSLLHHYYEEEYKNKTRQQTKLAFNELEKIEHEI